MDRRSTTAWAITLLSFFGAFAAGAQSPPLAIGGDPRVDPDDYRVTVFASGLDFPLGMAELADGSLLVGMNREPFAGASLLNSDGELVRFVDADLDGLADGPGQVLASGLHAVTSLRVVDDLAFVATGAIGNPRIEVWRLGAAPDDPLTFLGRVDVTLPLPWRHLTFSLAARPRPGVTGEFEVFFNMGSREDATASVDLAQAAGLWSGSLVPDALYRMHVDDTGAALSVVGIDAIATGLRNAFGQAFEPATGDLFVQDNGSDAPEAADELNVIAAADVGGAVEDFGFPSTYVTHPGGVPVGSSGLPAFVYFLPLPGGEASTGPVELAFAPRTFGALSGGLFQAFFGNGAGTANVTNPIVWVDPMTGEYFHFVAAGQATVGHLASLLATEDTLYAADLTAASGLSNYGTGAIYAIRLRPACDDGRDNDADGTIDWAGLDANDDGDLLDPGDFPPDAVCGGDPNMRREARRCGAGAEVAGAALVVLLATRRRRASTAPRGA
jgi:glucose/arabinose dehydrogenase